MIVGRITVDDADSLEAAADLLEPYGNYCARMADDLAAEHGVVPDADTSDAAWATYNPDRNDGNYLLVTVTSADDPDPEPPSSAAPAVLPDRCRGCGGTGTKRYWVGGRLTDWIEERCLRCDGTGTALPACRCCRGTGMSPHPDHAGKPCWLCDGTGRDAEAGEATPPTVNPFDRMAA
jgi:hypothetical protein